MMKATKILIVELIALVIAGYSADILFGGPATIIVGLIIVVIAIYVFILTSGDSE